MSRAADYTIQGFVYQFIKSLEVILNSKLSDVIRLEGLIEDIDIARGTSIEGIQCKYHESISNYKLSDIYDPLLQMMLHYQMNSKAKVTYTLYAYFPDLSGLTNFSIKKSDLETILATKNSNYKKYKDEIGTAFDYKGFLKAFNFIPGMRFDDLENKAKELLVKEGLPDKEIDTLIFPNAIDIIARKSILHDPTSRTITKLDLLESLKKIRTTAINHWTLSLKSADKVLQERRKQLRVNLAKNARLRAFLISEKKLANFDNAIVMFIKDYLEKYHFKIVHNQTPVFSLDCDSASFDNICNRLHRRGVKYVDGLRGGKFESDFFFHAPIVKYRPTPIEREFDIRVVRHDDHPDVLRSSHCDDLFVCASEELIPSGIVDSSIEILNTTDIKQFRYLIGVDDEWK